jgi:hypothetical protein
MELRLTLPLGYSFDDNNETRQSMNILSNETLHRFKEKLNEDLPYMRFLDQYTTNHSWTIIDSSDRIYNILLEFKERRREKKIIIRPRSILDNDNHDVANLSKLYLILINTIIESYIN